MLPWGSDKKPEGQPKHKPLHSSLGDVFLSQLNWLKQNWEKVLMVNPRCLRCSLLQGRRAEEQVKISCLSLSLRHQCQEQQMLSTPLLCLGS